MLARIEVALYSAGGGRDQFRQKFTALVRQVIDEVIDARRTNRFTLEELEKTEKTYIGTKVEILFRNLFDLDRGNTLDLKIDGIEVDVKNTIGSGWMIPLEALGKPCILIRINEKHARCWLGLLMMYESFLTAKPNQDEKRSVSKTGKQNIRWLLESVPYPKNFWHEIGTEKDAIIGLRGGTDRMAALFTRYQRRPIPRSVLEALGQKNNDMRRLRKGGGARDLLSKEGIAILSGKMDRDLISKLGLPTCTNDEFISFKPIVESDITLLRAAGHID